MATFLTQDETEAIRRHIDEALVFTRRHIEAAGGAV